MQTFETSWWERCGETEWKETADGTRHKSTIFRCISTGEEKVAGDLPIAALYAIDRDFALGPNDWPPAGADGLSIACVCLGSRGPDSRYHWYIDNRASNCTKPADLEHRCWVRHGTVGDKLTVDKNGLTCGAGAGSFFMGPNNEWHGFLRDGRLTP